MNFFFLYVVKLLNYLKSGTLVSSTNSFCYALDPNWDNTYVLTLDEAHLSRTVRYNNLQGLDYYDPCLL